MGPSEDTAPIASRAMAAAADRSIAAKMGLPSKSNGRGNHHEQEVRNICTCKKEIGETVRAGDEIATE